MAFHEYLVDIPYIVLINMKRVVCWPKFYFTIPTYV